MSRKWKAAFALSVALTIGSMGVAVAHSPESNNRYGATVICPRLSEDSLDHVELIRYVDHPVYQDTIVFRCVPGF